MLALLSDSFASGKSILDKPVAEFFALQVGAGIIYLLTLAELRRHSTWLTLGAVILCGLTIRLAQFPAQPVMETDFYRYLWDGALAANGVSPYEFSPDDARLPLSDEFIPPPVIVPDDSPASISEETSATLTENVPRVVRNLAEESGGVVHNVNHPFLRTIYPPTAQATFVAAYFVAPFDIIGLRWIWLGLDIAILGILCWLLRGGKDTAFRAGVYWLNPLLVKEAFNSAHMELAVIVFALLALWAAMKYRGWLSLVLLALATGAKIWPVIWLPLFFKRLRRRRGRMFVGIFLFAAVAGLLTWPILDSRLDTKSGFTAYAGTWKMNDSVHMVIHETCKWVTPSTNAESDLPTKNEGDSTLPWLTPDMMSKSIAGVILLAFVGWLTWRMRDDDDAGFSTTIMASTACLFLISPTQFPWYFLWLLPLLAIRPLWSLLGLTVTLPIYYLRFPMKALSLESSYDYGLVWLEYVPIWILLILEIWWRRRHARRESPLKEDACIAKHG
ncbi:MAG: DUF2029 domain-containing protein [Pirellulales bacterium]|nr:DUF2029 domain-containing protein [Pirellulales bacterium]